MLKPTVIQRLIMVMFAYGSIAQAEEMTNARGVILKSTDKKLVLAEETSNTRGVTVQNVAGDDVIIIDGDNMDLHLDRKLHASGNAIITRGKQSIVGDEINYDMQNDELHVQGNAQILLGNGKLTGPEIKMRLSDNVGEIKNASVQLYQAKPISKSQLNAPSSEIFAKRLGGLQSQQIGGDSSYSLATPVSEFTNIDYSNQNDFSSNSTSLSTNARGDADTILFEGQDKKHLKNARYTTCEAGVNDWYIKAKDLELNDYSESGVAKNAYIEFKGVPLLYTPWISFSYNKQRKSGLLAPTYGTTSKSGLELLVPYYWNISPDMDATLATRLLSKRGIQYQGELRYLNPDYSGLVNLEYLPSDDQTNENRYFASLKHQHILGSGWSAGYNVEKVSDDQYFSDLSTRIVTTSRVLLPQQLNLNYSDEIWRFSALAQKFQTLDKASYPYERLPELTLIGNNYYGDLNANLYTQTVAFNDSNPLATSPTGVRTTLYPSISYPLTKSYGYITPKIGVHYTNYQLSNIASNLESQSRSLPIFSLDSGLYFDRDMQFRGENFIQTVEPRMYYVYIPDKKQSNIPIFDTSEADLNFTTLFSENQFTGNDRINNANQLSFGLTTRFIDSETGAQRLSASVGQRYYYADQVVTLPGQTARQNNSSDIIAGFTANLKSDLNVNAFWQYNTDDSKSVRTTLTSRYNPEPGKALNLSYSFRQSLVDQFDISGQWPLGKGWYGIGRVNYSLREKRSIESLAGLEYDAGCWQTRTVIQRVSTATSDANYALFFQLELGGLASIGANPMSVIKRNIPGYVSTNRIPDSYQQPYYE
jgi:LPS-assembly protein